MESRDEEMTAKGDREVNFFSGTTEARKVPRMGIYV